MTHILVACPSCWSGQRVPAHDEDRMVTCRRCGEVRWWCWVREGAIEPVSLVLPPVADVVSHAFRREVSLELRDLWAAIARVFTKHVGHPPPPSQRAVIEREVVESRFERYLAEPWKWLMDDPMIARRSEGGIRLRGGTPFHVRENTSPAQDNAIRAMEGD